MTGWYDQYPTVVGPVSSAAETVRDFSLNFELKFSGRQLKDSPSDYVEIVDRLIEMIEDFAERSLNAAERSRSTHPVAPAQARAA